RAADFDQYTDNLFPGGVPNRRILDLVNELMEWHAGGPCLGDRAACGLIGFQPVDEDRDFSLLQAAVKDHQLNVGGAAFSRLVFADDKLDRATMFDYSSISDLPAIRQSRVPVRLSASWLDGTTADGALRRFNEAPEVPTEVFIGATTHPAGLDADPFAETP